MTIDDPRNLERLRAENESVEYLVEQVLLGRVRTPEFQRGLRWKASDVVALFDSMLRNYPIGSLLFQRARAKAERVSLGPIPIDAPETESALWTIDGQQRLTALAATLAHPLPLPTRPDAHDPWVVWFDSKHERFVAPQRDGVIPTTWVPLPELRDATKLGEWLYQWEHGTDAEMRRRVLDASRRIREYRIPYYVVASSDEEVLREIFRRINNTGKRLEWPEVHQALFGHRGVEPSTLPGLLNELASMGAGRPTTNQLLQAVLATHGFDVTQTLDEHLRGGRRNQMPGMVSGALPALRLAIDFLRRSAGIAHLRLLPRTEPFLVIGRFFYMHRDPTPRSVELLKSWFWRVLVGSNAMSERTLLRRAIAAVDTDEEESVQRLLQLGLNARPERFSLRDAFDARKANSRLAAVSLASLTPIDLESGLPIDVAKLLEDAAADAFRRIVPPGPGQRSSVANRLFHPGGGRARSMLSSYIAAHGELSDALRSHAIEPEAARAWQAGDIDRFLEVRGQAIEARLEQVSDRMATWSASTRPTIEHLKKRARGSE